MKPTTVFLTSDLARLLRDTARRESRSQAENVSEALTRYLRAQLLPWPRSVGMGDDAEPSVTSENVKDWVREVGREELAGTDPPER